MTSTTGTAISRAGEASLLQLLKPIHHLIDIEEPTVDEVEAVPQSRIM